MSTSTDGQICYGVLFPEDYEFPWENEEGEGIEDWWLYKVNKFPRPDFYLPDGEITRENPYKPDSTPEQRETYWSARSKHQKENPPPVVLVNAQYIDAPLYILAIPSSCQYASRGEPQRFDPGALTVTNAQVNDLLNFCKVYELEYEGEPGWFLSSYWG